MAVLLANGSAAYAIYRKRQKNIIDDSATTDTPLTTTEPINSASVEIAVSYTPYLSHLTTDSDSISTGSQKKRDKNHSPNLSSDSRDLENDN